MHHSQMFIGIDIGSISAKMAIIDSSRNIVHSEYILHRGNPLGAASQLVAHARNAGCARYSRMCVTGSGRKTAGRVLGADLVKNEITATWKAAVTMMPDVKTVIEIGGQDSKLIALESGEITRFKLNSVCAAGTGSFIEQQSNRLGVTLDELSTLALRSPDAAKFTGRCTVFVETEMINLQQMGYRVEEIAAGLIDAICENYLHDLGPGMRIESPVLFCGGVSDIQAVRVRMEKKIAQTLIVPVINKITAAYGAALLAHEQNALSDESDIVMKELPAELSYPVRTRRAECQHTDCLHCGICYEKGRQ